jgi:hypothetical protein
MLKGMLQARPVRARALQTSAITLAIMAAGPAFGQCAPDPTPVNGTTICSGTDANGLVVTTAGTRVVVDATATVLAATGPAIAVRLPTTTFGPGATIAVAGRVDGGGLAGVDFTTQSVTGGGFSSDQYLALTVAAGGTVTGSNGVVVGQAAGGFNRASVTLDNAGTITGTGGYALVSTSANYAGFSQMTNRAGGRIGAIAAPVGTLVNAGTIDGGTRSAIDFGNGFFGSGAITNTGTITAAIGTATMANLGFARTLTNSGSIVNTGSGVAVAGDAIILTNAAGGRIAGGSGGVAIRTNTFLTLTNAGTIDGNVVTSTSTASFSGSSIDSSAGLINGSVTFGAGNNRLYAGWNGTGFVTGITGTVLGGSGIDTLRIAPASDTTIATVIPLPTGFERLSIAPAAGITTTLADGYGNGGTLLFGGAGTVVNRTRLAAGQQVFTIDGDTTAGFSFVNAGTIATTAGTIATSFGVVSTYAADFLYGSFTNSSTVTATGDGIYFRSSGRFANRGSIVATGTALNVSGAASFANSGLIRSTTAIGATMSGSSGADWLNSGRIEGAIGGAKLGSRLINTGTIIGTGTSGIGVVLDPYGGIDNRAGGVITGAVTAIGPQTGGDLFAATVVNAGTINGNVALTRSQLDTYNFNRFFALSGGVLNGNLTLATGDVLIADLGTGGAIGGVTGTITPNGATLRYRVRRDASAAFAAPTGFAGVGYDLYDGAALTLTGAASTRQLILAGTGSIDLTADLTATTQPAIAIGQILIAPGETAPTTSGGVTLTTRGAITLTRTDANSYPGSAITLGETSSVTNAGTITVRDRTGTTNSFSQTVAINSGKTVTNTGTISLDGVVGIQNAVAVVNSGTIGQIAAGRAATGVRNARSVTNIGTIDVAGVAIEGSNNTIDNAGRIASSGGAAINGYATIVNRAGGTIAGGAGQAIQMTGGTVTNTGTITGGIDLGWTSYGARGFSSATYIADGGTIAGDLRFGEGFDTLVSYLDGAGVSGTVDGGGGTDTLIHARRATATVTLGTSGFRGFEVEGVRALGTGTVVTVAAATPVASLALDGDGNIVNTATVTGRVTATGFLPSYEPMVSGRTVLLAGFTNQGTIGSFTGPVQRFANSGTAGAATLANAAVLIDQSAAIDLSNSGTITNDTSRAALRVTADTSIAIANSGTIGGGGLVAQNPYRYDPEVTAPVAIALTNSGTITGQGGAATLILNTTETIGGTLSLANSGTIAAAAAGGTAGYLSIRPTYDQSAAATMTVTNAGAIRANAGGIVRTNGSLPGASFFTDAATALTLDGPYFGTNRGTATVVNAAVGVLEATGTRSTVLLADESTLDLTNAGTIRGTAGTSLTAGDQLADSIGRAFLAGAIQTVGSASDRVVNTGSIIGSIDLSAGNDRIENYGRIEGEVFLGAGDDSFLHRASATLIGTVDAGTGDDSLVIDATGGGTVRAAQFINFERFSQIGAGAVQYVGAFRAETLGVSGGTVTVAAGETLSSTGTVTVTGGDGVETVLNDGTIAGSVALGAGNDRVVNAGTITGAVLLGDGDDGFVERAGSRVAGGVDGGAGTDRYTVALTGDRSGIGARSGFELLSVEGNGTLTLALDQSFEAVTLAGTGLALTLGGNRVGAVTGSDARETLSVDGDVAQVSLGAGDDVLALGTATAAGRYAGGTGTDTLRFTAPGTTTLAGTATGFEQVALTGPLVVTGTLGSTGAPLSFGTGDQQLTIADGGRLAGLVDLGAGNDGFRLAANAVLDGTVAGGAGDDSATLVLAGARTLAAATLTGFETLATEGAGTLTLTGSHGYDRVLASGNLTIGTGAGLTARDLRFSGADNRLTIAGGFAGAVDGGAGTDTIAISGGSAAAPVAFTTIANVEALAMSGGFATIAGNATLGSVDLTGGRLVGLAGSVLRADRIAVAQGATFGSAGTVTGNLTVAGILSPGASPGTMTVNGNVALATGARALFELTPTVSDRLVVNGALSIAGGTTLEIVSAGALRPGTSYDLITASGGITGAFATVVKPADLFGFIVQRADRIQLLGQFLGDARFAPQVARSIAYANATLAVQPATSTLFAALPALVEPSGASNARAFAQLTPEAYATATQLGVDHALALGQAARGPAFATTREEAGLFTFAQTLGQWHRLAGDPAQGSAGARSQSYGFLGGLGFGDRDWSVGAFAGYLNGRQQIEALGARTRADGAVAGVQGRYTAPQGWGFAASLLYDGGKARTDRALPGGRGAGGRYDLHSWVSDLSAHYAADIAGGWTLQPRLGVTYVRTTRDGVAEGGTNPFALRVARDRHVAGFADAGLSFARSEASDAALRPFVSLGARYQIEGRRVDALAGYAGGALGLTGVGASRARLVGTAAGGIGYRLASGLDLFTTASAQTGRDDHQETITTGVRLRF